MNKQHIIHLLKVVLKFYFDFDLAPMHVTYIGIVVSCLVGTSINLAIEGLRDGIQTVRDDIHQFRVNVAELRDDLLNSQAYELISNNMKFIKSNLTEDTRNWRLKIGNFRMIK